MNGATTVVAGKTRRVKSDEQDITVDALLDELNTDDFQAVIFLAGEGVESYWDDPKIHQLVKSALAGKKIIGAIGAAAPILVHADEQLLAKKITSDENNAKIMLDKKSNYTGKDIENDENIFSTTGFNKEIIDGFLAKIKNPIKEYQPPKPGTKK